MTSAEVIDVGLRAQSLPEMKAVVKVLREDHGAKAVGAQGFCWGGAFSLTCSAHVSAIVLLE